jgi:hypothetical protein
MRIAVAIEIDRDFAGFAFEQFRRRVVLLKIDEHGSLYRAGHFGPDRLAAIRKWRAVIT